MTPDDQKNDSILRIRGVLEGAVMVLLAAILLALAGWTALGALGLLPMLSVPATLGGEAFDAGPALQTGAAVLLLAVLTLTPGLRHIRRLEAAHRDFRVGMEDVTRAYWAAHAADRAGVFTMAREFDAVRERFEFLRRHPNLQDLAPELLELAAQMSTEARDLADIYSDEKVAHAEAMLVERQAEAERLGGLIDRAHEVTRDIRRALGDVELEEDVLRSRIAVLREELDGLWREIDAPAPRPEPEPRLRLAAE
ncbi:MAG: DNA repair protein [Paracoccaceae bacterium]|nr:DNA repair protein [Paracoccaceae bacterium]